MSATWGGGECDSICALLCNPECGGTPCLPECAESPWFDECYEHEDCDPPPPECDDGGGDPGDDPCKIEIESAVPLDDDDPLVCAGSETMWFCASECPPECEDDCDPDDWKWTVGPVDVAQIVGPDDLGCVEVMFVGPGTATITFEHDCCTGDTLEVTSLLVLIDGPLGTTEGEDSEEFQAIVEPAFIQADSYEWMADWPPNVGHTLGVNFESPAAQSTRVLKATWYAEPDSRWKSDTPAQAPYEITVAVNVGNAVCISSPYPWIVDVTISGTIDPWPIFSGDTTIQVEQNPEDNLWYVAGKGQFVRHQLTPVVDAPLTSDFYIQTFWHEDWHSVQFAGIWPWKDMWDVDQFYENVLKELPGQESEVLIWELIAQEGTAWNNMNQLWFKAWQCEMEAQAYEVEYNYDPRYRETHPDEVPGIYECSFH